MRISSQESTAAFSGGDRRASSGIRQLHASRIDMVVDLPSDIFIVEFMPDKSASAAVKQMEGKDYAGKYAFPGKRVALIVS